MRTVKFHFQWFENDRRPRVLRASVNKESKLYLNAELKKVLPSDIRVGFDSKYRILAIADGQGRGRRLPSSPVMYVDGLANQLYQLDISLPVGFLMQYDEIQRCWIGVMEPIRANDLDPERDDCYLDVERLLQSHRFLIDNIAYQVAKTTPLEERRAAAATAFYQAAIEYRPECGDLTEYLSRRVREQLIEYNKQFTAVAKNEIASMDADFPGCENKGNHFGMHHTTADRIDEIEQGLDRMMEEQFEYLLLPQEKSFTQWLGMVARLKRLPIN